ncbi:hypothetical protein [Halorubrum lipolyticum]|uniref:DUF7993 domain-containing protein n=1 Tax=Halorubrum lipolyticum DSM 21995 TaxID=1227482 RepID=M0NLK3_9EURY|nr:hypothetical protein [Halorubrum lipolyticum]EMA58696.1 hypothetical protein C469_12770 [Halorubrum lipolyticum DSM 21995]
MVAERLTDGLRIGQLLASEITGDEGRLRDLALTDADPDVEPTPDGALAYRVVRGGHGNGDDPVAEAFVQPDRLRLEFVAESGWDGTDDAPDRPEIAADAAGDAGLRVRPKAVRPPRTLVFVEDGAQVKRALSVFEAVVAI